MAHWGWDTKRHVHFLEFYFISPLLPRWDSTLLFYAHLQDLEAVKTRRTGHSSFDPVMCIYGASFPIFDFQLDGFSWT